MSHRARTVSCETNPTDPDTLQLACCVTPTTELIKSTDRDQRPHRPDRWSGGNAAPDGLPCPAISDLDETNPIRSGKDGRPAIPLNRRSDLNNRSIKSQAYCTDVAQNHPRGKPAGTSETKPMSFGGADVVSRSGRWAATGAIHPFAPARTKQSKVFLRKEVIQPQVPLRLPCYDLVPITGFIFGACLAAPATSDTPRFGGLTGGVYKAQEHIHRGMLIRDY